MKSSQWRKVARKMTKPFENLICINRNQNVAYSDDLPPVMTFIKETIECLDKLVEAYEKGVKNEH